MSSAVVIGLFLTIPGLLVTGMFRCGGLRLLVVLALSYSFFIANLVLLNLFSVGIGWIGLIYAIELTTIVGFRLWVLRHLGPHSSRQKHRSKSAKIFQFMPEYLISIFASLWILITGPYLEVPADAYEHIGRINHYLRMLEYQSFDIAQPWYLLVALALHVTGQEVQELLLPFSIGGTVLFLLGISSVSRAIGKETTFPPKYLACFCFLAATFTTLMFGTSVFSFIRYYVFAPALINYLLFLVASYLLFLLFSAKNQKFNSRTAVIVALILATTYLVHRQEALFIVTFMLTMWLYKILEKTIDLARSKRDYRQGNVQALVIHCLALGTTIIVFVLVWVPFETGPEISVLANNTIDLAPILGFTKPVLVADPLGRVFETVGTTGLIVIAVYFLLIRSDHRHLYLTIIIVIPVLIVFNPMVLSFFLLISQQELIWRFVYMVPIGIITGFVCTNLLRRIRNDQAKSLMGLGVIVLAFLPFDSNGIWQQHRYSTLQKISRGNSPAIWEDLVDHIGKYRYRNILTDPVTGYVLKAMTTNNYSGFKFHAGGHHINLNKEEYGTDSFAGYVGWLFVINLRDGEYSLNGDISNHWQSNIMEVSNYYSLALREFLNSPPEHFQLRWRKDNIRVFEITRRRIE